MTWRVEAGTLVPANDKARSWMLKSKSDELVAVDAVRKRNLKHHNKYWKLLEIVVENSDVFTDPRQVHMCVKAAMGHGSWVQPPKATKAVFCEAPTNFGSMDQTGFEAFYGGAVNIILKHFMPGVDPDALDRLAMDF